MARFGSRWVLWCAARDAASGCQCISVGTSAVPGGPFVDANARPAICQLDHGGFIDPAVSISPNGSAELLSKSDDKAIAKAT